jgi:cytochrome P450
MEAFVTTAPTALAQLFTQDYFNNPYPAYEEMQQLPAPIFIEPLNLWLISRYDDCVAASKDMRFSSEYRTSPGDLKADAVAALVTAQNETMLFRDAPVHTRLRALVHKAFTPAMVQNMRHMVQSVVNELMDRVEGREEIDLIADFAYPLPIRIILEMIGIPLEDHEKMREWSRDILVGSDLGVPDELKVVGNESMKRFFAYLDALIDERRNDPRNDLLSALIAAEEEGDKLSLTELKATCVLLVIAGHETTTNLIANGMLALLNHPDQLQLLRNDLELLPEAVEEMLRYDSPVQTNPRVVTEDFMFQGQLMRQGQLVGIIVGAANRDEFHFPNADVFHIKRLQKNHVGFGYGIHYCVGAPLARLEANIAFKTMLQRWQHIELTDAPLNYVPTPRVRALTSLPLRIKAR